MKTSITITDFLSRNCKHGNHNYCASRWQGLGIEIACGCRCHSSEKEKALPLNEESGGNTSTSTFKGPIQHDDN